MSTSTTSRVTVRMAAFISATYESRCPKSVVRVMIARPLCATAATSAVAIHHEVGDEGERLALLRGRELLQIRLRREGVAEGARPGVFHPVVLEDQAPDLVDVGVARSATAQQAPHALGLRG